MIYSGIVDDLNRILFLKGWYVMR